MGRRKSVGNVVRPQRSVVFQSYRTWTTSLRDCERKKHKRVSNKSVFPPLLLRLMATPSSEATAATAGCWMCRVAVSMSDDCPRTEADIAGLAICTQLPSIASKASNLASSIGLQRGDTPRRTTGSRRVWVVLAATCHKARRKASRGNPGLENQASLG